VQHLDTIKVFYLPTDAQYSCFKRILKFRIKQLLHVSVQSPSSGNALFELVKDKVIKIISENTSVWLVRWCGCSQGCGKWHKDFGDCDFAKLLQI